MPLSELKTNGYSPSQTQSRNVPPVPQPQPTAGHSEEQANLAVNCQPVLRPDASSVWSLAETETQRLYVAVSQACASLGIDAYVARNNAFEIDYNVLFQAWVPVDNNPYLTKRVSAHFRLIPKPSHKYALEYHLTIKNAGDEVGQKTDIYATFSEASIVRLLMYLVGDGATPSFPQEIQQHRHNFFEKFSTLKNKVVGVRHNYLGIIFGWLLLLGIVAGFIGYNVDNSPVLFGGVAAAIISVIVLWIVYRKPLLIRSTGRPDYQPRVLRLYDTWQVVLSGAGVSRDLFYERFLDVLRYSPIQDFKAQIEPIAYRVLGELVSREQLVLSARRGVIYCQIYPFGNDLFIGWQSFLNRGCWVETLVASGIDRSTGHRVKLQSVTPGFEGLCEYDYADANCLT